MHRHSLLPFLENTNARRLRCFYYRFSARVIFNGDEATPSNILMIFLMAHRPIGLRRYRRPSVEHFATSAYNAVTSRRGSFIEMRSAGRAPRASKMSRLRRYFSTLLHIFIRGLHIHENGRHASCGYRMFVFILCYYRSACHKV